MKKVMLFLAIAASAMTVSAQEGFYGNKFFDNWYIGLQGGVSTKTTHQAVLKNLNPNVGVRVGKWITPSFGIAGEGNLMFSNKASGENYTNPSINVSSASLLGQLNLTNMFCGYLGEPRNFEIIANAGIGYIHNYTDDKEDLSIGTIKNAITQKLAIDFTWNFGNKKQWQFYVEPSLNYLIAGAKPGVVNEAGVGSQTCAYDINYSYMQLNVGINYKFKTSNDTHNFMLVEACDQNMINALNAEINSLRGKDAEIDALKKEIEDLKKALKECEEKPAPVVVEKEIEPNLPAVFYPLNKSVITPAQAQNVAIAAAVMKNHPELKLQVQGYASPEGPHDNNNTLSINRAKAVKDLLVKKYNIDPSRITTEGCGETDKLFEIYEFNRVAMLYIEK